MKKNRGLGNITFLAIYVFTFISGEVWAKNLDRAKALWKKKNKSPQAMALMASELQRQGYFLASIPYWAQALKGGRSQWSEEREKAFAQLFARTGGNFLEKLPSSLFSFRYSPTLNYLAARKHFRKGNYQKAIKRLRQFPHSHPFFSQAMLMAGSSSYLMKDFQKSFSFFYQCASKTHSSSFWSAQGQAQRFWPKFVQDSCSAGLARVNFTQKKYEAAERAYLDVDKKGHLWPHLLREEAWNNFYQGKYNRSLGKLVTYKAPLFRRFDRGQIHALRAHSFYKLCLEEDLALEVEDFYNTYERPIQKLEQILGNKRNKRNFRYFYRLAEKEAYSANTPPLIQNILKKTRGKFSYKTTRQALLAGERELKNLKESVGRKSILKNDPFAKILAKNILRSMKALQNSLGELVRRELVIAYREYQKTFEYMANFKLEQLRRKKRNLYAGEVLFQGSKKRGDPRYLKKNDKQYFWTFDGEFWADELGDFVFSLASRCEK